MKESTPLADAKARLQLARRIAFAHYASVNIGTVERFEELGVTPDGLFEMDSRQIASITGVRQKVIEAMRDADLFARALKEVDFIAENGISPVWHKDENYPALLRHCSDAPAMLYVLGSLPKPGMRTLAIVGTRHCTAYGRGFIERFVADLAASLDNLLIVSGLALGVDIAAHRAAIKEGVPTGAVMAEGLNRVYPAEHRSDAVRIVREGGFLMSEYLSSDSTNRGHFLARNRIVAGLADVTVVVESDIRGGAMVTARLASDYHREVMAVPGRAIDQYSRGCNELIASNTARILRDAGDLINAMGWMPERQPGHQTSLTPELPPEQKMIMQFLQTHPDATVNDVAIALGRPVAEASTRLFELEMDGFVNAVAGGRYLVVMPV